MPTLRIPDDLLPALEYQINVLQEPVLKMCLAMNAERIEASAETIQWLQSTFVDQIQSFTGWTHRKKKPLFEKAALLFLNDAILHDSLYQATQQQQFQAFDLLAECIPGDTNILTDFLVHWKKKAQGPQDIANLMRWCSNSTLFSYEKAFNSNVNAYQCVEWVRRLNEHQHDKLFATDQIWQYLFEHQMHSHMSSPMLIQAVQTLLTDVSLQHSLHDQHFAIGALAIALDPNNNDCRVALETILPYLASTEPYYFDKNEMESFTEDYEKLRAYVVYQMANHYNDIQVATALWAMAMDKPEYWSETWFTSLLEEKFVFGQCPTVWRALAVSMTEVSRHCNTTWTFTHNDESKSISDAWRMLHDLQAITTEDWSWLHRVRLESGTLHYQQGSTSPLELPSNLNEDSTIKP